MAVRIRDLTADDADAVGHIWATARKAAYRGIVPDAVADTGPEAVTKGFAESFTDPSSFGFIVEDGGRPVGFATGGHPQHGRPGYDGELSLIYVLPDAQGRGVGRMLVHAIAQGFAVRQVRSMLLWTIGANRAGRDFYDRLGGTVIAKEWSEKNDGWVVAYGWPDITTLLERTAPRA